MSNKMRQYIDIASSSSTTIRCTTSRVLMRYVMFCPCVFIWTSKINGTVQFVDEMMASSDGVLNRYPRQYLEETMSRTSDLAQNFDKDLDPFSLINRFEQAVLACIVMKKSAWPSLTNLSGRLLFREIRHIVKTKKDFALDMMSKDALPFDKFSKTRALVQTSIDVGLSDLSDLSDLAKMAMSVATFVMAQHWFKAYSSPSRLALDSDPINALSHAVNNGGYDEYDAMVVAVKEQLEFLDNHRPASPTHPLPSRPSFGFPSWAEVQQMLSSPLEQTPPSPPLPTSTPPRISCFDNPKIVTFDQVKDQLAAAWSKLPSNPTDIYVKDIDKRGLMLDASKVLNSVFGQEQWRCKYGEDYTASVQWDSHLNHPEIEVTVLDTKNKSIVLDNKTTSTIGEYEYPVIVRRGFETEL